MRNFIEEDHEYEMPCVCDCGNVFDLNDGYGHGGTTVCPECHEREEHRTELNGELFELENELSDAKYILENHPKAIQELKDKIDKL